MNRQFFGTDGIRGKYGGPVINPVFAHRLGVAVARWMKHRAVAKPGGGRPQVLIGRDTRDSGPVLEGALAAGLAAEGFAPFSLGVVPTPAVSRAVRIRGAALGAVITASHNPATDNGIKFFGPAGSKLTDADEAAIEQQLVRVADPEPNVVAGVPIQTIATAADDYIHEALRLLPSGCLKGWRIVLDTANGATCGTSPVVLRGLGAEIIGIGDRTGRPEHQCRRGQRKPCAVGRDGRCSPAGRGWGSPTTATATGAYCAMSAAGFWMATRF
jgi:phosphoglucosamine mutase